jgi:hypothetical protein
MDELVVVAPLGTRNTSTLAGVFAKAAGEPPLNARLNPDLKMPVTSQRGLLKVLHHHGQQAAD